MKIREEDLKVFLADLKEIKDRVVPVLQTMNRRWYDQDKENTNSRMIALSTGRVAYHTTHIGGNMTVNVFGASEISFPELCEYMRRLKNTSSTKNDPMLLSSGRVVRHDDRGVILTEDQIAMSDEELHEYHLVMQVLIASALHSKAFPDVIPISSFH